MDKRFLYGYVKFEAKIKTLTGLRIGGRRETIEIGGIDLQAIKDPVTGFPYIPGSSLKGKLRSLVEKINNKVILQPDGKREAGEPYGIDGKKPEELATGKEYFIIRIFGNHKGDVGLEPRLIVRDFICLEKDRDKIYEIKVENIVNRITGTAEHPREVERVRKGIEFKGEIIYKLLGWGILEEKDVLNQAKEELKKLEQAIEYLMKYDYLGGSGTRGYGKVALWFEKIEVELDGKKTELILQADKNRGTFKINVKGEQNELVNYLKEFMEKIYLTALQEAKEYGEQI